MNEEIFEDMLEETGVDEPSDAAETGSSNSVEMPEETDASVTGDNQESEIIEPDSPGEAFTSVPGNYDNAAIVQQLEQTNMLLTTIVFLILFVWVESRLRPAVWRYFGNGKPN